MNTVPADCALLSRRTMAKKFLQIIEDYNKAMERINARKRDGDTHSDDMFYRLNAQMHKDTLHKMKGSIMAGEDTISGSDLASYSFSFLANVKALEDDISVV